MADNPFFQDEISFDPIQHKYTDKKGNALISVSQLISKFTPPFDPTGIILHKCAEREGIPKHELKAQWEKKGKDACDLGTAIHAEVEYFFLGGEVRESPYKNLVSEFAEKAVIKGKVYPEVLVYSIHLGIAGLADIAAYMAEDNSVSIQDIKSNADIYKKSYGKMLYPLEHLKDSSLNKYGLQLSLYSYLMELRGFKIRDKENCIYWMNPSKKLEIIHVPYLKKEVETMICHFLSSE